ncbi:DUF1573 domain-containing protein [Pedobacter frigoris]|uniref:DUF1573 domain-containing protein n=1 Tax=Pedobacter frigoris TaxID=2571272 RepID=UPI00292CD47B|nr:DUF1573 domain-containing protein [Pedobacter frigoris]
MKNAPILIYIFYLFILGCKPKKADINFNGLLSLDKILENQKTQDKYLALVLTMSGCDLCDFYKKQLLSLNQSKTTPFNSDLEIKSIDVKNENFWFNQLLREYSFPLTVIFDKNGEVKGFFRGARPEILVTALKSVYSGKIYYRSKDYFLNSAKTDSFSGEQKLDFINQVLKGTKLLKSNKTLNTDEINSLSKNVDQMPYFFNSYLLAKAMMLVKDTIGAQNIARETLKKYNREIDAILYHSLKNELRYLTDNQYQDFNEALITTPQTEINFGAENVGIFKKITIPIKNSGKKPLLINNVKVSCDCIKAIWPKEYLPPGKTAEITVSYKLKEAGIFNQNVFVFSNSATEPLKININGVAQITNN